MSDQLWVDDYPEVERYELRAPAPYEFHTSRREFVQVLGAGLLLAVSARPLSAQQRGGQGRGRGGAAAAEKVADRFHIAPDGIVTVLTSKVEVGQGARTQLAMAAAEELGLPIEQLRVLTADSDVCPDDGGTAGSRTTPATVPRVRNAAANARELLLTLAAKKLEVGPRSVNFTAGVFTSNDGRRLTLAELAAADSFASELEAVPGVSPAVHPVAAWKVLGTPVKKINGLDVVTGANEFPSDIKRPGMLYGKILRPAGYNATLAAIDLTVAQSRPGVVVVRDGNFVGCAAPTSWEAQQAVDALAATARWNVPAQISSEELFPHLKSTANATGGRGGRGGNAAAPEAAVRDSFKTLRQSWQVAYIQHAPMEPRAAVAEWNGDKVTVWTGTQQPARVQSELQQAFGISASNVRVIVPDTGGGFGGKHNGEAAAEAARLAKAAGKPVSLRWSRSEEFTWAYFRPAGVIEVAAGVDEQGKLTAWDFTNYNSGNAALETPYTVAANRARFLSSDAPLRQGSYRGLASTANTFARECAMDELAELAGLDPLEFRLRNLADGRLKDVLLAAAEKFGWKDRWANHSAPASGGVARGIGLACGIEKGSYVAAAVDVEIRDGKIIVHKVTQAYECGAIQNPANLRAQVEGGIIMGLGGALIEEIRFRDGRITNASFGEYPVPRMRDVPELDLVLLNRTDLASVGAGETPIIAVAPAIAGAVWKATGRRLRSLPMRL